MQILNILFTCVLTSWFAGARDGAHDVLVHITQGLAERQAARAWHRDTARGKGIAQRDSTRQIPAAAAAANPGGGGMDKTNERQNTRTEQ